MKQVNYEDGTRAYETAHGIFPSVTTILSNTGDKSALEAWKERIGHEEAERIRLDAAARGSLLHEAIEGYLLDDMARHERAMSEGAEPWFLSIQESGLLDMIDFDADMLIEEPLYHGEAGYAGTGDLVANVRGAYKHSTHKRTVLDWKTSSKRKQRDWITDYFCQCGAYILAHNWMRRNAGKDHWPRAERGLIVVCYEDAPADLFWLRAVDMRDRYMAEWAARIAEFSEGRNRT